MGFLGNLFGAGKVDVEGSISVLNRPAETFFVMTVHFFPCAPGSGPLADGMPDESMLAIAIEATPEQQQLKRIGDIGERFGTRLAPGHYQVCVSALPMVLETSPETGNPKLITDPNNRFAFWPVPTATAVKEGQKRVLSLKLNFPPGLGKFGERLVSPPLLERIGEENRAAYMHAVEQARRGDLGAAFEAYGQALASPGVDRLLPADANELRLVLTLGQYKCLAEAGRAQEAVSLLQQVTATLLPRVRLSEADPATAWDMTSTLAIAGALELKEKLVVDALPAAIELLLPQLKTGHEGVEAMVGAAVSSCLRPFVAAQQWSSAFEVAAAVLKTLAPLGAHPLTAIPRAYQLEGYLASAGTGGEQQIVSEIAPQGRAVLLRVAGAERLERLARALAPVATGATRA